MTRRELFGRSFVRAMSTRISAEIGQSRFRPSSVFFPLTIAVAFVAVVAHEQLSLEARTFLGEQIN